MRSRRVEKKALRRKKHKGDPDVWYDVERWFELGFSKATRNATLAMVPSNLRSAILEAALSSAPNETTYRARQQPDPAPAATAPAVPAPAPQANLLPASDPNVAACRAALKNLRTILDGTAYQDIGRELRMRYNYANTDFGWRLNKLTAEDSEMLAAELTERAMSAVNDEAEAATVPPEEEADPLRARRTHPGRRTGPPAAGEDVALPKSASKATKEA